MKTKIFFFVCTFFLLINLHAQQFISKAVVEYEVRANIKKTMGNGMFADMLKDKLPEFKTGYYNFTFADNKSIYKFDHWDEQSRKVPDFMRRGDEENAWYCDYTTGKLNMQKNVDGNNINIQDTLKKLNWKITNENRIIAGFNCRKAVAKIFDSVYVFVFYTDEIIIPGGPCSITGLPGLILGVTIPRLYTSWIATKVMLTGVNENIIKPVYAKKNYDLKFLETTINERMKDWYSRDETQNNEIKQQKARFMWGTLL